jgi:hypothetical protein
MKKRYLSQHDEFHQVSNITEAGLGMLTCPYSSIGRALP